MPKVLILESNTTLELAAETLERIWKSPHGTFLEMSPPEFGLPSMDFYAALTKDEQERLPADVEISAELRIRIKLLGYRSFVILSEEEKGLIARLRELD